LLFLFLVGAPGGNQPEILAAPDEDDRVETIFNKAERLKPMLTVNFADRRDYEVVAIRENLNGGREHQAVLGEIARRFASLHSNCINGRYG
jgi:hypothetical protein